MACLIQITIFPRIYFAKKIARLITIRIFAAPKPVSVVNNKHIIGILFLLLLTACGRHRQADALLAQADSLMASRPDAAYAMLDSVRDEARGTWGRADRMRYELTLAEAMNKAYVSFTTDSVMKRVARYYDRHGSANQQLKARYLLGCTYRDMGEAPAAINAWQEAVERADTTSTDCDYNTLYRVYGQMAEIYRKQGLFEKQLKAEEYSCHFAERTGSITDYIYALQLKIGALYNVGNILEVYRTTEKVRRLYLTENDQERAARIYSTSIRIAVENGQYKQAEPLMAIYEHESGLFDSVGNIAHPHEQYHYYKGLYYAGVNQLDSAESQFRKLLPVEGHQLEAYHGLFAIFQQKGGPDSVFKYGQLYEKALSAQTQTAQTNAVIQAENMYVYDRQHKTANKKSIVARRLSYTVIVLMLIALVMSTLLIFFKHKKDEKQDEVKQIAKTYHDTIVELEKAKKEAGELICKRAADKKTQAEKDTQIKQLKELVTDLKQKLNEPSEKGPAMEMKQDEITRYFRALAHSHPSKNNGKMISSRVATAEEWDEMVKMVRICHTSFYLFITTVNRLTVREYRVCILSRLDFCITEISTLLDCSEENVTNIRRLIAKKLFGISSSLGLNKKLAEL